MWTPMSMSGPPPWIFLLSVDSPVRDAPAPEGLDADVEHLAEKALRYPGLRGPGRRREPLLETDLEEPAGPPGRLFHEDRFLDRPGHGLFHEDVLPGLEGGDGLLAVQIVRRADAHRVDVLPFEEFPPVLREKREFRSQRKFSLRFSGFRARSPRRFPRKYFFFRLSICLRAILPEPRKPMRQVFFMLSSLKPWNRPWPPLPGSAR